MVYLSSQRLSMLATIRSDRLRCLDNARLTGATEEVARQWSDTLAEILCTYSVASTDVFNMDEAADTFHHRSSSQ